MSRVTFEKFIGAAQVKVRKSLQTLQISADKKGITGNNMVLPDNESEPSKKKQLDVVNKVIATEKENAPILRRSKRKTAMTDLSSYAESPDPKSKKTALKTKKGRSTTLKKNKPEIDFIQKKLNFPPVTSVLNKISDVFEPAPTDKSIVDISTPLEVKVTEDCGFDFSNGVATQSPIHSTQVPETCAAKQPSGISDKDTLILTSVNPPLIYWELLAEQRRVALGKTLRENRLLHDQLTVLEAENSELKQLLTGAEDLLRVIMDIMSEFHA